MMRIEVLVGTFGCLIVSFLVPNKLLSATGAILALISAILFVVMVALNKERI